MCSVVAFGSACVCQKETVRCRVVHGVTRQPHVFAEPAINQLAASRETRTVVRIGGHQRAADIDLVRKLAAFAGVVDNPVVLGGHERREVEMLEDRGTVVCHVAVECLRRN